MIMYKQLLAGVVGMSLMWSGCTDSSSSGAIVPVAAAANSPVQYYYDAIGRLVEAVSPDGVAVHYRYDAAGNITAVRRLAATTLSLIDFAPRLGAVGATITIYGSGFDSVPTGNVVTFNGAPAAVVDATGTALTVLVPAAANSGKVTVSNSRGNVTSEADFVLSADSRAPTIASFTPAIGTSGTQVTLADPGRHQIPAQRR